MFPRGFPHSVYTMSDISIGCSINWLLPRSVKLCLNQNLFDVKEYPDNYMGPLYDYQGKLSKVG